MLEDPGQLAALSARFERFGNVETLGASPLYTRFSLGLAADPALLKLAGQAQPDQPVANIFLAAVHYLLLKGAQSPLRAFYPGLGGTTSLQEADPYPFFRAFCLEHQAVILELIKTRLVQTNEVRRCALLLPAFERVAQQANGQELALLEIGTSAGLNLLWPRYGYDYGEGRACGDLNSPLQLHCRLQGELVPPLPIALPPVGFRVGLDLNPLDVRDTEDTNWLQALLWPEHLERAIRLEQALTIARQEPPLLLAGDALELLPDVLARIPPEMTLCLFHSFTLNQFSVSARTKLISLLEEVSQKRDLYKISIEWEAGDEAPLLKLDQFKNGSRQSQKLAHCHPHGEWLEWLQP